MQPFYKKDVKKKHKVQKEFRKKVVKIIPELYTGLILNLKAKRIT